MTSLKTIFLILTGALVGVSTPGIAADTSSPAPAATRGTFVIVHGAWGAGYEWKEVGRRLSVDGFTVYRPTLTGMGERSHLSNPEIDLDTHITDVVNTILFEDLHDVILVGHSYGGMVITGVADRVSDRIQKIIYVDAFLPESGEAANAPGRTLPVKDGFVPMPWNPPPSPPPHPMPQPAKTFSQALELKNQAATARIPTTYILTVDAGKKPEEDGFFRFYERAKARGYRTIVMESDHTPQFSHVPEIVSLLKDSTEK